MNYKATLASDKDGSNLVKSLLSLSPKTIEFEKETPSRVGIYVTLTGLEKIGIKECYLSTTLYDVDIVKILETIAPNKIVNGDQVESIKYDDFTFDSLICMAKIESDFIKNIDEWDINCES